jgi:hypothetical protein
MATKTTTKKDVLDTSNKITAQQLRDIVNLELDTIFADPSAVNTMPPLLIKGSPGCGKSSIVRSICEERGIEFIDVRLAQMEPCDIKGLPVPNREKNQMDWFINGSWPRDPNGKGIIFLDELTSADRSVQVAAYELVLDRRLGKLYQVPPGYLIVAAGNLTTDKAVATVMSSALANRFMHVQLQEDAEIWLDWGRANDIHPSVLGFIAFKPNLLFNMEGENLSSGWPSPRSWERVSKICHIYGNRTDDTLLRTMVYGLIGNGTGVEFMAFHKLNAQFANVLEYMTNPDKDVTEIISEKADMKYALTATMAYLVWKGKNPEDSAARLDGFFRIVNELTSDFAVMAFYAAYKTTNITEKASRCTALLKHPRYEEFKKKHYAKLKKYKFN